MFYDNFVRLCNKINKTPTAVAIEIGKSKATAHKWKNGTVPHNSTLRKIADYFCVTVEDLLQDAEKPPTQEGEGLTDLQQELIQIVRQLPDDLVSVLLAAAKTLLEIRRSQDDS